MHKKLITMVLLLVLTFNLTGCSDNTNKIIWGIDNDKEVVYTYSDNIYMAMEKLRNLNPIISKDKDMYFISKLTFDSLFVLDDQLVPEVKLVSSYSYNDEGTELVLTLKQGVLFHDGTQLTAEDVKFTIEAIQNLSKTNDTLYGSHVANIKQVTLSKEDPYKLTIKFNNQYGACLENLIFPIIPAHQFKNAAQVKSAKNYELIGTGPYKLKDYLELTSLVLVPFDDYFGIKASNEIHFQVMPNAGYAANMTDSGDISLFFDEAMNKDTILSRYELNVVTYLSNQPEVLGFNMQKSFLQNRKVRQAIAYAVDANDILENAYYGNGVLSDSIIYPNYYGSGNNGDPYIKDADKSKAYLISEGYSDIDEDGYLEDPEGNNIIIKLLVNSDLDYRVKAAELIKNDLQKIGIEVQIAAEPGGSYTASYYAGDFDVFLGGFVLDERYDLRSILHSGFGNPISYYSSTVDDLLVQMQKGLTYTEKYDLVCRLKETLNIDLPYYTLLYKTLGMYESYYFDGVANPMFNHIYRDCQNWRCKN